MPIGRNSFIQMTKLSNVKGRITYISSHAKQENLYAVYETTERKFWRELAKCNQEEFAKSGTEGKCIEARELIIALPESFVEYQSDSLLQLFTNHFKQNYGTECIAALHHNKRKTNYHIHLIFAERKLLDAPIIKTASRNMFYDENGKHVRTKKEILGEDGEIREGCYIVKKGEVYERKLFTAKDERFKSNSFLDEVKHSYTDLINIYVQDEKEKLQVFERGGVYLAMKKIGKNNPKAHEIEEDNQKRQEWNRAVDMALVSGVSEPQIMEVKRKQITESIKESVARRGNRPRLFAQVVTVAIEALEFLIESVLFKKSREVPEKIKMAQAGIMETENTGHVAENIMSESVYIKEEKAEPKQPEMTRLASKYPKLFKVHKELDEQNRAIRQKQKQLSAKKKELSEVKGRFKGRKKKELQEEIDELASQIRDMKDYLPRIVQRSGYRSVQEFLKDFKVSQTEYSKYRIAIEKWKKETGKETESHGIKAKLAAKKQEIQNEQKNKQRTHGQNKDRGAR
ncbi:MAG: MobA/MobL family protein [Bariatricus sp.]|uniref:MobA/MobL family protein n=1 Tax=Lachnospiraceae TaxID=186803 RepID=UPI002A85956E|nr:MobA/MobL family protein [Bariatricus sp.]